MTTVGVDILVRLADRLTAPMRAVENSVGAAARRMSKALSVPMRMDLASAGLRDISAGMSALASRSKGLAVGLAAYAGTLAGIGISFVGPAAEMERFTVQLTNLEGSAAGAKTAMAWISDFATKTPLELNSTVAAYARLKAFGLDPTNGSLQALVDTMAATGGGAEQLDGLVMALGQSWTKGKLQSEEALQMLERGVPVWDLLAEKLGKSSAEVQELATKGKLGRKEIMLLVEALGQRNAGAADGMAKTWGGILSNLSDHWTRFQIMVMNSGVFDYLKGRLQLFLDLLNQMAADGRLQAWADWLAARILGAMRAIWDFGVTLVEVWRTIQPWLASAATFLGGWGQLMAVIAGAAYAKTLLGIAAAIATVTRGVFFLSRALMLNPIGLVIAAIAGAAYLIYQYWEPISAFFQNLWARVTGIFAGALDWIGGAIDSVTGFDWAWLFSMDALATAWGALKGFLGRGLAGLWDALCPLAWFGIVRSEDLVAAWGAVTSFMSTAGGAIWGVITTIDWSRWLGLDALASAWRGVTGFFGAIRWSDMLPSWQWVSIIPVYDLGQRLFFGKATPTFDWDVEARKSAAEHSAGVDRGALSDKDRKRLEKNDAWRAKTHGVKAPVIENPETLIQAANAARQLEAQFPLVTAAANATLTAVQAVIAQVAALLQGTDFTAQGARIANTIAAGIRAQIGEVSAAAAAMGAAIRSALPNAANINIGLSGGAKVQPRASGGWFKPGWLLTGESGPELEYRSEGGFIAHNRALRGMLDMATSISTLMAGLGGSGGQVPAMASVAASGAPGLARGAVSLQPVFNVPITLSGTNLSLQEVQAVVRRELAVAAERVGVEARRVLHD